MTAVSPAAAPRSVPAARRWSIDIVAWSLPLYAFLLVALEEFPSGLGEMGAEGVERSTRTPFYAKSLGLAGLYPSDLGLLAVLGLLVMSAVLLRRKRWFAMDLTGGAVIAIVAMVILSSVISLAAGNPFSNSNLPTDNTTILYDMNQRALKMIAVFQVKNFLMLLPAYLCGLLYLDRPDRLDRLILGVLAGCLALAAEGFVRMARHPGVVLHGNPLFFDSPSSWFFALFAFYAVSAWGRDDLPGFRAMLFGAASLVFLLLVLISFRRTMWGGIALSGAAVIVSLPGKARRRLILGGAAVLAVAGAALFASPVGGLILQKVSERVHQTGVGDMSTLYRLAMFVHFFKTGDDTPFFGWGVTPLWNKLTQFGYLSFNLENMHSLYFWIWLRTGAAGTTVALLAFLVLVGRGLQVCITTRASKSKTMAITVLAMLVIFLFSGGFNPVYGEFRYIVPLGFALAVLTRLPQFDRQA